MSALVTEAHIALSARITRENGYDPESNWNRPHVLRDAQYIADSEAKAVSAANLRSDCANREVDRWVKWREEQPWLAEIQSYQQQVKSLSDEVARLKARLYQGCDDERYMTISEGPAHGVCGLAEELTKRAERTEAALETCRKQLEIRERIGNAAEVQLHAIQQGHGELGRYEKLRLKYAAAIAHADLMVDELKRILALVPEDSEIGDLCKRGIKNTYQHLPVLTQRDEAVQQALVMEAELAKERARLDAVVKNCWLVNKSDEGAFAVFSHVCGDYITPWLETKRAAIDEAMKEETK